MAPCTVKKKARYTNQGTEQISEGLSLKVSSVCRKSRGKGRSGILEGGTSTR
jgi:hypothetical protein